MLLLLLRAEVLARERRVATGRVVRVMVAPFLHPPAGPSTVAGPHGVVLQGAALGQLPALATFPGVAPQVSVHGHLSFESGLARPALPLACSSSASSSSSAVPPGERERVRGTERGRGEIRWESRGSVLYPCDIAVQLLSCECLPKKKSISKGLQSTCQDRWLHRETHSTFSRMQGKVNSISH